ncbi:phage holin family protein [Nakamurella lactea]|uniref:phage holin family protein n=1 Tax=Nakamurella lactea TaxID=459515 RepID=UPI00048E9167|nr:phage holin family protein [Nakamurella lactea]
MVRRVLIMWLILAVALGVAAWLIPDVHIKYGSFALIGLAALYGLVNAVIGPILRLLTVPLNVITLGLFSIVVNAILLAITAGISDVLDLGGFLQTVIAAIVISAVTTVLHLILLGRKHHDKAK